MKSQIDAFEIVMALIVVSALAFAYFSRTGPSQGVVLFNMDRAHRDMGRDKVLIGEVEKKESALNQKFEELQSELKKQFEQQKNSFGDSPTKEQLEKLSRLEKEQASKLAQETMKNRQLLQQFVLGAISRFGEEVRPVTQQVAAKHNASIVLNLTAEQVISFGKAADITDEVVEAIKLGKRSHVGEKDEALR